VIMLAVRPLGVLSPSGHALLSGLPTISPDFFLFCLLASVLAFLSAAVYPP
jgi:hypothetical protein